MKTSYFPVTRMKTFLISITLFLMILPSAFILNSCKKDKDSIPQSKDLKTVSTGDQSVLFYQHEIFTRITSAPVVDKKTIGSSDIVNFEPDFVVHIQNGDGLNNLVSSAIIKIDGVRIFGPSDFSQQTSSLSKPISNLTENSILEVELRGAPGSYIDFWIEGTLKPVNSTIIIGNYHNIGYRIHPATGLLPVDVNEALRYVDIKTVIKAQVAEYTLYSALIELTPDIIVVAGVNCYKVKVKVIDPVSNMEPQGGSGMFLTFTGDNTHIPIPATNDVNYYNPITKTFVLNYYYNPSAPRIIYEVLTRI